MGSAVAIGLVTCERYDYTARTVRTLSEHNDLGRFRALLHADDASASSRNRAIAASAGFRSIETPTDRSGGMAMKQLLLRAAIAAGCDWLLLLENDWESDRAFPWALFEEAAARPDVYCMRLYAVNKERNGRPCGTRHAGRGKGDPGWKPFGSTEPAQIGSIHYGAPPSVVRTSALQYLITGADHDRVARMRSGKLDLLTVRPMANVMFHIGEHTTPDYKH